MHTAVCGNEYGGNHGITSVAVQPAVNTTIEGEVFSAWFAYIHCWAMDVFSVGPPQEREQEWSQSSAMKEYKGLAED